MLAGESGQGVSSVPTPISTGPLSVIDILDGGFSALRQRPRVLVSLAAVVVVPTAILRGLLARNLLGGHSLLDVVSDPTVAEEVSQQSAIGPEVLLDYVVDWFVLAVAGVGVSRVVAGWFWGRDIGAVEAARFTAKRSVPVVSAFVLNHLAQWGAGLLLILPGIYVMVIFSLTSPVLAVEELGSVSALSRSAKLVRRSFGRVLGVVVLIGVVGYVVDLLVGFIPTVAAFVIGAGRGWPLLAASEILSSIILVPFVASAMCLLYLDIRFRTEGLDLIRRAETQFPQTSTDG